MAAGRAAVWLGLALGVFAAGTGAACAQQYFNGSQTTPNGAINGGGGVWNGTTTNWTNDTGTVSSAYDPSALTTTIFGASATLTPAGGGVVTVAPSGVQLTGSVIFNVTGDNSIYTIQGGDLTLAVGGTTIAVADVTGTAAPSAVISSRIVGGDALSVQGPGTLALLGPSTYTGGTFICTCASLQLGDATHTASIVGDVTNEGFFNIVNANTAGITSIRNDGGFGRGITTFLNATTASSIAITNIFGGQTYFGTFGGNDTATAGNATIVNGARGTTVFFARTNGGTASIINGRNGETVFIEQSSAGSATIVNTFGVTTFGQAFGTDTPTAGNATITNNFLGRTQFGAFSTAGNATIITNSRGETDFFDNSTGGNARFITNGSGVVDFGGSIGPNGDGRITAGSIEGSGNYYIGGGNTLVVGSNNLSTEVSGRISDSNPCGCGPAGPGSLEKVGSGTLILSGRNDYTGTTTVNGGILQVDGTTFPSILTTVNAGGALAGTGVVGETLIASGGIFAPGHGLPGSSMQVMGNLAFQSGALYLVTLDSNGSSFATVTGNAALDGTVLASFISGSTVLPKYKIMDVGSTSGNFSGLAAPGGLVGAISFDPTSVYLNFTLDWSSKFNLGVNQQNAAGALTGFFNANGGIPLVFAALAPAGLTQVSGEPATGAQQTTFNAMNLFLGLLIDPFAAGRGAGFGGSSDATPFADTDQANSYAAARNPRGKQERDAYAMITKAVPSNDLMNPRWSIWAAGFGGSQTTDGNLMLGSTTVSSRVLGTAVGFDYLLSPRTIAGFALAGGGTSFSLANGLGGGRSDLFQAGAFVRHQAGSAYVTGALAYGWQDVTTDRTVTAAGVDRLRAEFSASTFAGRIEGGYRYATPWMGIAPYAAAQFTTINLPGYAEGVVSGANTFALTYAAKSVTDTRTELGVRTDKSFARPDGILTLRGRLAWAHDFNPDRNVGAVFQTLPGAAFVVNGAAQARDSALTTASAEMKWLNGWSAIATFEGEFSSVTRSYAGKGIARYAW